MKKLLFLFTAVTFVIWSAKAQDSVPPLQYDMTFKGRGEATTVQSVTVENLSTGKTLTLSGDKVLRLTNSPTIGVEEWGVLPKVTSLIYPNPSYGQANLVFANRAEGNVSISIYDMMGRTVTAGTFFLETGKHTAVLPAMPTGNYIVSIQGKGIREAIKWISTGSGFGGTISLNGFDPNMDESSISAPKPQFSPKTPNSIVEMLYADGELLRFTGKNGNMATIVMNIPTLSHDITFDFHPCTDAAGYHYAIINAGGMLWMAEDLRNIPTTVVPIRTSVSQWAGYPADQPKQAYYNFSASNAEMGAYYNYSGAKVALPQGWNLPTAGEVDYMFIKLGGYNRAANLLKERGDAWAQQQHVPDTVSFRAIAYGDLSPEGIFAGEEFRIKYWTRSTTKTIPIFWGIENAQVLLNKEITASVGHGLRVRGCRPAPSAYTDVAEQFNSGKGERGGRLFEDGPLGGMYTLSLEKQNLWQSFNAPTEANPVMKYLDYHTGNMVPLANKTGYTNRLQKATGVENQSGRQNLAVALWSRGSGLTSNGIEGDGYISIVTFGDSTKGYAKIDSIRLPTQYNLPPYEGFNRLITAHTKDYGTEGQIIPFTTENPVYALALQMRLNLALETGAGGMQT